MNINKIENITKYYYKIVCVNDISFDYYNIENNFDLFKNNKDFYYILDNCGSDAFIHFVLECFIFIPLLIELNKYNNNIKILTTNKKRYVINLLNFFKIPNEIVYDITNYNNICYYPNQYSLNNLYNIENDMYYMKYFNNYIEYIKNNLNSLSLNNLLFLPRNTKDNYIPNDRIINNTNKIKEIIIEKNGIILNTYDLNNIKYQLSIVNNSDIIILDYGSSLFFNCLILENKNIYVLDDSNIKDYQYNNYTYIRFLYNYISSKNNIKIIKTYDFDILNNL